MPRRGQRRPARAAGAPRRPKRPAPPGPTPREPDREFRLGVVAGATPGKWVAAWRERMPHVPLELHALEAREQRRALTDGVVDAALVRLPVEPEGLSIVRLYDEVAVAVTPADSHLTTADELTLSDLAGEVVIVPRDDVLDVAVPGAQAPAFAPPETTADAIATVAAGVGIVIVPMSLARLHARRDVAHRPLRDGPVSPVALAWLREADTPDIQTFVGIVRGRTANSSR